MKKATVGFFAPGNLRFSLKNTIKFDRTMGENDGVEPSSKNHGGVDQMQNAFETPPFVPTVGGRELRQRLEWYHPEG